MANTQRDQRNDYVDLREAIAQIDAEIRELTDRLNTAQETRRCFLRIKEQLEQPSYERGM